MADHAFGRRVLASVWQDVLGTPPTVRDLQMVGAISAGEGGYGRHTYKERSIPDGAVLSSVSDSNNWGAVQCAHGPPCGESCFPVTDSSPRFRKPENPKGLYTWCYERHPSPEVGARKYLSFLLVKHPSVREALATGSARAVAQAMYRTHYYEGFKSTEEENVADYTRRILEKARDIAFALGEPLLVKDTVAGPTPAGGAEQEAESSGWIWVFLGALGIGAALALGGRRR